eukprot:6389062-Prymnesium_polylepis.4
MPTNKPVHNTNTVMVQVSNTQLHAQNPFINPGIQAEALGQVEEDGAGTVTGNNTSLMRCSSNAMRRTASVARSAFFMPSALCAFDSASRRCLEARVSSSFDSASRRCLEAHVSSSIGSKRRCCTSGTHTAIAVSSLRHVSILSSGANHGKPSSGSW